MCYTRTGALPFLDVQRRNLKGGYKVAKNIEMNPVEFASRLGTLRNQHANILTAPTFNELVQKIQLTLRATMRHPPVLASWENNAIRAASVLAMHTLKPIETLREVLGVVMDSDVRWIEELSSEIEDSDPHPAIVVDLLNAMLYI